MKTLLNEKYLPVGLFKTGYVLVAYLTSVLTLISLSFLGGAFGLEGSLGGSWAPCLQFILFVVLCVGFVWLLQGRPLASDWGLIWSQPKRIVFFAFSFSALFLAVSYGLESMFESMAEASKKSFLSVGLDGKMAEVMPLILAITVLAPIGEEVLYRGLMFRAFRDGLTRYLPLKYTIWIAVTLSAIAFALSHGNIDQKPQLGALVLMGVLLAVAYQLTGSLFTTVITHSVNNTVVLLLGAVMYKDTVNVPISTLCLIALGPVLSFFLMRVLTQVLPKVSR